MYIILINIIKVCHRLYLYHVLMCVPYDAFVSKLEIIDARCFIVEDAGHIRIITLTVLLSMCQSRTNMLQHEMGKQCFGMIQNSYELISIMINSTI